MTIYKRITTFLFIATAIAVLRGLFMYLGVASSYYQGSSNYATSSRQIKLNKFAFFEPTTNDNHYQSPQILEKNHTCKGSRGWVTYPKVPSFIIAGAQKSGTTALYNILKKHPMIISKTGRNEGHYFNRHFLEKPIQIHKYQPENRGHMSALVNEEVWCDRGLAYIKDIFKRRMHKLSKFISFEKTPAYLHCPHIPELISIVCPWKPKVIILLRNPVDRAYSHYDMDVHRKQNFTFEEVIQNNFRNLEKSGILLKGGEPNPKWLKHELAFKVARLDNNVVFRGFYANQLEYWFEHFPLGEKLMVVRYENFVKNKAAIISEILEFVGASQHNYTHDDFHTNYFLKNKTNVVDGVSKSARTSLEKIFKPHNDKLADLLGEEWRDIW